MYGEPGAGAAPVVSGAPRAALGWENSAMTSATTPMISQHDADAVDHAPSAGCR